MQILVTAGNTLVPIDRVRCLTNVFTGRTGAAIALQAHERQHTVTLITSHPDAVGTPPPPGRWRCVTYRTFADLHALLAEHVTSGHYDAVIHAAAVSDYEAAGVYAPAPGTTFDAETLRWHGGQLADRAAGKIKSDAPELWLRLVRTPKLIDQMREPWGFRGVLVKFKLEVGIADDVLVSIAESSRCQSDADLMVANTLEGSRDWAYLGSAAGYERIARRDLPRRLIAAVEEQRRG